MLTFFILHLNKNILSTIGTSINNPQSHKQLHKSLTKTGSPPTCESGLDIRWYNQLFIRYDYSTILMIFCIQTMSIKWNSRSLSGTAGSTPHYNLMRHIICIWASLWSIIHHLICINVKHVVPFDICSCQQAAWAKKLVIMSNQQRNRTR